MPLVQSMNFSITTGIRKKFLKLKAPYSITQNHDDFSTVVARLVHHPEFTLLAQHHDANDDGSISMFKWDGHQTWILVDRWLPTVCEVSIKSRAAHENLTLALSIIEGLSLSSALTVDDISPDRYSGWDEPF